MSARGKLVIAAGAPASPAQFPFPIVGRLVAPTAGAPIRIDFDGNPHGPVVPRVATSVGQNALAAAVRDGLQPLVLLEGGDPARPVIVALLPSATPLLDAVLAPAAGPPAEARVDGKRVVLEGATEVVLRCGKASIVLRADGQVTIRGVAIRSEARGTHRIRGGKVEIN